MKTIILTGEKLTIKDIQTLISNREIKVKIPSSILQKAFFARHFIDKEMNNMVIYGVNTGFGPMASHLLAKEQLVDLQNNLIRSHAVGMGIPIDESYVLAAMVIRLNMFAKGFSGASPALMKCLQKFINLRIIPVVYEHGGVGASGDLVQLAHMALGLIGEGKVMFHGKLHLTATVLKKLKIKPYQLKSKEGLALINGTSVMTGISAIVCLHAEKLISLAIKTGALALEIIEGFDDSISEKLHGLRPHHGQVFVAKEIRNIVKSSNLLRKRKSFQKKIQMPSSDVRKILDSVQEVYSLRCIPQIIGPVFDAFTKTKKDIEIEANSVTDNPIIDWENKAFLHGGNFHGDYIAASIDQLKASLVKLTLLSERRTNFFMNHKVNGCFPPFLNLKQPGLILALQGLQFVATSTTAHSQSLAFPHHIHSIPTNADNQDVVSMGTDASLFAMKVVDNAYIVLAIELVTLAQAVDAASCQEKLSQPSRILFKKIRSIFPKIENDNVIIDELERVTNFIKNDPTLNII